MKKLHYSLLLLTLLAFTSVCFAKDFEPSKHIVLMYKVPDSVLMCQNSKEDMVKGAIEFEKELKNHYGKRFIVDAIKRLPVLPKLSASDYTSMVKNNQEPFIFHLELTGTGVKTITYQNMFGAKISTNIPSIKMKRSEFIVNKQDDAIYGVEYNEVEYHSDTMAIGREIVSNTDMRKNTKNCIRGYIRDYSIYQGEKLNKYANPRGYADYIDCFAGNFKEVNKRQIESSTNKAYLGILFEELSIIHMNNKEAFAKAGGKLNDKIVSINETPINTEQDLYSLLNNHKPGDTLITKVLRNGSEITLNICAGVRTINIFKEAKI